MAVVLDVDDPCASAKTLKNVRLQIVAGLQAEAIEFSSANGVSRSISYSKVNLDDLERVITALETECAALSGGGAARRAVATGGGVY